jgi:hypothetical protein
MPALLPHQIADLVTGTLRDFQKDNWVDFSLPLQRYVGTSALLMNKKVALEGGEQLQWFVKVANSGAAKNTGLYDTVVINVPDVMKTAVIPWSLQITYFAYDERESAFQGGDMMQLYDLIKLRRNVSLTDLAELTEKNLFGYPANLTNQDEVIRPRGLPYWITAGGATSTFGFNGVHPSGHSDVASLSASTYSGWRNGNAKWTTVSEADLVSKWREATMKCDFQHPVPAPVPGSPSNRGAYGFLTVYPVIDKLVQLHKAQNENLGTDLDRFNGETVFRGNPVVWAPYIEQNLTSIDSAFTTNSEPIYGISWNQFECVFRSGYFMLERPPQEVRDQPFVKAVFICSMQQYRCFDRRRNFVLYKE